MLEELEKTRFVSLCSDTTFKYLFKDEESRKWFYSIIKGKFGLELDGYKLVDNEQNTGNGIKDYRMDIVLEKDDNIVIVEMNQDYYEFLQTKNYQYLYRVAGNRFEKGERYKTKPTKLILFNNFKNRKDETMKIGNYLLMDPTSKIVIEDIESYEIYLPNFHKMCYDNNEVDVSLSLFNANSYESMKELTNNPKDIKIIEELEKLGTNEEFIYDYDHEAVKKKTENSIREESYEKGLEQGIEQGLEQGMERGIEQGKIITAKNMLQENYDEEEIIRLTGLTLEEISELK